jgi:adenine-specific DNA-methyltransferase
MRNSLASIDYDKTLLYMDELRSLTSQRITAENKKELGQFFTSSAIANFMANMFSDTKIEERKLLDCGAGIGSLTIPAIHKLENTDFVEA